MIAASTLGRFYRSTPRWARNFSVLDVKLEAANWHVGDGRKIRREKVEDDPKAFLRALLQEHVRGPRDDRELGMRNRLVQRTGVGERCDVIVAGHHEHRDGNRREVNRGQIRLAVGHDPRLFLDDRRVTRSVGRVFAEALSPRSEVVTFSVEGWHW